MPNQHRSTSSRSRSKKKIGKLPIFACLLCLPCWQHLHRLWCLQTMS